MPAVKKASGRKKKAPSTFARFTALFERYTLASFAGASVLAGLILLVLWSGGYFGMMGRSAARFVGDTTASAGLRVERVLLRGAHQTAHEDVVKALGPALGTSILRLSLDEARARVESLAWVRSATVSRLYPNTVSIAIREREPAAVWQIEGELRLIDDGGAIITEVGAYEYSNLPLLVGVGAPEAAAGVLRALANHEELQERVYALIRIGDRSWNMRLRNNIEIKLPAVDYAKAIDDIALLQTAQSTLDQPIEYIDLRDPERMVIRKRGEPELKPDAQPPAGEATG